MADEQNQTPKRKRDTIMPERFMRRVLEEVGDVVDRKLGRTPDTQAGATTTDHLIRRMNALIDERARNDSKRGRIAPHHLKLKIEWGKHSETAPEVTKRLEHEILAAAIDHINDSRYRTLAPVTIETDVDIFTKGLAVDPTFGQFEDELRQEDLERKLGKDFKKLAGREVNPSVAMTARITAPDGSREVSLEFVPGGRRVNVGRGTDNDLHLNHPSVSKIHAALKMDNLGTLLVADTGSTNGTHVNGERIPYGEAHPVNEGDLLAFGDVEVRFRKLNS